MNINELAKEVHENAVNHGWWEKPPSLPEALCLIHAELSEALEEYRNGSPLVYGTCALSPDDCDFALTCENVGHPDAGGEKAGACKPEGDSGRAGRRDPPNHRPHGRARGRR